MNNLQKNLNQFIFFTEADQKPSFKLIREISIDKVNIKSSLDILYNVMSNTSNLISSKIKVILLIDTCLNKKNSVFINFFLQHVLYKNLVRYLLYENLSEESRFVIFFNQQTQDIDNFVEFFETLLILFIKWDKQFGKIKQGNTPFHTNLVKIIQENEDAKKYKEYTQQIEQEIKYFLTKGMKFVMFIKFLFKMDDANEIRTNIKSILKFKNKNLFQIDKAVFQEYKQVDIIYEKKNLKHIQYFSQFQKSSIDLLDNFAQEKISLEQLFENLKIVVLDFNNEFSILDKYNYDKHKIPQNMDKIIKNSYIDFQQNQTVKKFEKEKKNDDEINNFLLQSFLEQNEQKCSSNSSIKESVILNSLKDPSQNNNLNLYYCSYAPDRQNAMQMVKNKTIKNYKLKEHMLLQLLDQLQNQEKKQIPEDKIVNKVIEIDFLKNIEESMDQIKQGQNNIKSNLIQQNQFLLNNITNLEKEIEEMDKKLSKLKTDRQNNQQQISQKLKNIINGE